MLKVDCQHCLASDLTEMRKIEIFIAPPKTSAKTLKSESTIEVEMNSKE